MHSVAHRRQSLQSVRKKIHKSRYFYLMFALPLLYYIIFHYVPMAGIALVFRKYNVYAGYWNSRYVGLRYFRDFLTDPYFYKLLRNTVLLGVYQIIFAFPVPILLAMLINDVRHTGFKRVVQTVSYMPHFLSTVVVCGMITNFCTTEGLLNVILTRFGIPPKQYLMAPQYFRTIYIVSGIWQSAGWSSIIYLAALTGIDPQLYEAATIDGATRGQQMRHVTLPGIMPTITIMFIFQVGNITAVSFEKVLLLYNGLTYETADVISTYVYRRGLVGNDFSYATAVGLFNSVISFLFLAMANFVSGQLGGSSIWGGKQS